MSDAPSGPADATPPSSASPPPAEAPVRPNGGGSGVNRTPVVVALVVLLTAATVGLIVARLGGDGDTAEPAPSTAPPPGVTDPDDGAAATTEPPGTASTTATTAITQSIDGVAVIESGFSTYRGVGGLAGSYGLVLQNTRDEPITRLTVLVVVLDTKDTPVGSYEHDVGMLNPGARLGVGGEVPDALPNGIGRLVVRVAPAEAQGDITPPDGTFTVANVSTSTDEFGMHTTFTVSSSYEVPFERAHAYAVYRNASGRISGGASGIVDGIPRRGRATGELTSFTVVPDVAATEVYVDPGF